MKNYILKFVLTSVIILFTTELLLSQTAVQFKVPITLKNGSDSTVLYIGVSGDGPNPPGTIIDNTIGADVDTVFGEYQEILAPPTPPPPFNFDARLVTLPGRISTFPIGLGGGVFKDYRGYFASNQIDSFKIVISGDNTDNNPTVVSWSNNLNLYGTQWIIKPQTGSDWPTTNMLTNTSVTIPAGAHKNIIIIKTGAMQPLPGPTFNFSQSSINFGTISVNGTASQIITVTNTGNQNNLVINSITSITHFTVTPNPPTAFPITVNPGGSYNFNVTFNPTDTGSFSGNISFVHNAPGSPSLLAVSGVSTSQGGTLNFTNSTKQLNDTTRNVIESLRLSYAGTPMKAFQFILVTDSLVTLKSVSKGNDLSSASWVITSVIDTNGKYDTAKVVVYGLDSTDLKAGNYTDLVRFVYDVKILRSDTLKTGVNKMLEVLGSTALGNNCQLLGGSDQTLTIRRVQKKGDPSKDGRIDILDILMTVDHILGTGVFDTTTAKIADIAPWPNGDGKVNVQDLALMLNIILTKQYPDGSPAIPTFDDLFRNISRINKTNSSDIDLTFNVNKDGISVEVKNNIQFRGIQFDINNIKNTLNGNIISKFGQTYSNLNGNSLRVVNFDQSSSVAVEPGLHKNFITIPVSLNNFDELNVSEVIVGDKNAKGIKNISYKIIVDNQVPVLPKEYRLEQNYPNPFNPSTTITFAVPYKSYVKLVIYNLLGEEVKTLVSDEIEAGVKTIIWNGTDNKGNLLSSGTYLYRMTAGDYSETKKMSLIK